MLKEQKRGQKKQIAAGVVLFLANLLFFLTVWLLITYDKVSISQFMYQLKTSAEGTARSLTESAFFFVGGCGIVFTAVGIGLYALLTGRLRNQLRDKRYSRYCAGKACTFFKTHALSSALVLLAISGTLFLSKMNAAAYAYTTATESDFIEDHYVDPATAKLTFPEKKRNLIYIFLESMESTFGDTGAGGSITENFIPELTALASEHTSFSNTSGLGGALSYDGTTWTAAALVSQSSGITIKVPLSADNFGGENAYLPGIISLGDILDEQGYAQTLLFGSDAEFANRECYFTEHGNYTIIDIESLKAEGKLPEDYTVWWGYEDEKLFGFAKEAITELAGSGQPFNFTMLTADTHFPDGYLCDLCRETYEEQYANVLTCSSRQVYEFVQWIMEQPFYENTTIILSGDHLTMDPNFLADISEDYVRTTYNCIINAAAEPAKETNRQFGSFDMFPTTLAAMGVKIKGDRLGLGTNLFSEAKTLTEEYGFHFLDIELQKTSAYYNTKLLMLEE